MNPASWLYLVGPIVGIGFGIALGGLLARRVRARKQSAENSMLTLTKTGQGVLKAELPDDFIIVRSRSQIGMWGCLIGLFASMLIVVGISERRWNTTYHLTANVAVTSTQLYLGIGIILAVLAAVVVIVMMAWQVHVGIDGIEAHELFHRHRFLAYGDVSRVANKGSVAYVGGGLGSPTSFAVWGPSNRKFVEVQYLYLGCALLRARIMKERPDLFRHNFIDRVAPAESALAKYRAPIANVPSPVDSLIAERRQAARKGG